MRIEDELIFALQQPLNTTINILALLQKLSHTSPKLIYILNFLKATQNTLRTTFTFRASSYTCGIVNFILHAPISARAFILQNGLRRHTKRASIDRKLDETQVIKMGRL